jgi:hypothetical protein
MESFHFSVNIAPNVDPWNEDHDLVIDIHAYSTMTLDSIHSEILSALELKDSSKFYYYLPNGQMLEKDKHNTLEKLGIGSAAEMTLDRMRRDIYEENDPTRASENAISVYCITRIGATEDCPLKRTKVIVDIRDDCADMMNEISHKWGKSALKFKYGRTILKAGKTFEEQGIDDGCEIVVTGGRG